MMKKIFAILLALTFICFGTVSAFATTPEEDAASLVEASAESIEESTISADDTAESKDEVDFDITFTTDNLGKAATHMGIGMLGVFIVLSLIALVVMLLNKTFKPKQ